MVIKRALAFHSNYLFRYHVITVVFKKTEPKNCFSVTSQRQGSINIFTEIHYFPTQIPVKSLQLRQALLM